MKCEQWKGGQKLSGLKKKKVVISKKLVSEETEGSLGQAIVRNIDQTPSMKLHEGVKLGLCFKSCNLSPKLSGKAARPLSRLLPFGVPCGEVEVVKRQEERALCYMKTRVATGKGPSTEE